MKPVIASNLALVLCALSSLTFAAPIHWDVQLEVFERVYRPHPKCSSPHSEMSEMECNNFRARALKRFQKEWAADAYWKDGRIIENPSADKRVNAESGK